MSSPKLSIIIVAYNMQREIPRTIESLLPPIQVGISDEDYEIIILDNGSNPPLDLPPANGANIKVFHMENPSRSPAAAINFGIRQATGEMVGVLIDGARMASPGLLKSVLMAEKLSQRAIIATVGFHLGDEIQSVSVTKGYNQAYEDKLLSEVKWRENGYRLFDISVFAGSSSNGWFYPLSESNAIFMSKSVWEELGGYDEAFKCSGGGLVNLDLYARACALPESQTVILLGEGTFHQFHGGVSSNAEVSRWEEFHDEYVKIRGHAFVRPTIEPTYFGKIPKQVIPFIKSSAESVSNTRSSHTSSLLSKMSRLWPIGRK